MKSEMAPATFVDYWSRTGLEIESELKRRIPQIFATDPDKELVAVLRAVDGGKRIRGCLVCLVCNTLGGATAAAVPSAIAIECVQAASLIHDDYIDNDLTRRNRPAAWVVDGSRRAVLVGDVMFATAIEQMARNGAEEGALIARTIAEMARGAYLEQTDGRALAAAASGRRYEYVARLYDEIVRLKTAVLFAAAAKFGTIAARAPRNLRQKAFDFGLCLGEAYQLADDLAEIGALQNRSEVDATDILKIAPMVIRFSDLRSRGLDHLNSANAGAFSQWVLSEIPAVHEHVTQAIEDLQRKSVSLLADLPDNRFKFILQDMLEEVTKAAR